MMRSKSPEKRGRQKVVRAPTHRLENEYNPEAMPQYFQITVNILEDRNLAWFNPQSSKAYVNLLIGKKKYKASIRRTTAMLWNEETFIFDLYLNLCDLQKKNLWIAVMEPKRRGSRHLGETNVNLGEIWAQPNHQFFQKWVKLMPMGYLKVNVTITLKSDFQVQPLIVNNQNHEDAHSLSTASECLPANYVITLYGAIGLPITADYKAHKRLGNTTTTFVRVTFCGQVVKIALRSLINNPMYCEQISIVEMFPNAQQIINFGICTNDGLYDRVLGSAELHVEDISHDGENGFLPTFGPSPLHVYANFNMRSSCMANGDGPFHVGALVVACNVIVPYYQRSPRSVAVGPVPPISVETIWSFEDICVYCPIFEVSMLDRRIADRLCGVAITVGEMELNNKTDGVQYFEFRSTEAFTQINFVQLNIEFTKMMNDTRSRKLHYTGSLKVFDSEREYGYLDFSNAFPVLQFATRLPDFRCKMYRNNMLQEVVDKLEVAINDVEKRLRIYDYCCPSELLAKLMKALEVADKVIVKFLDTIKQSNLLSAIPWDRMKQYNTILDQKQIILQKEEIEKVRQKILYKIKFATIHTRDDSVTTISKKNKVRCRKPVKVLLTDLRMICQDIKNITYKSCHGWSEIIVWLLNGGTRVAFSKISPVDVIYSEIPEQCGKNCGRIQTIFMKPLRCSKHVDQFSSDCHCIAGKIEILVWMGLHRHKPAFNSCLLGFDLKMKDYDMCIKSNAMMVECRAFIGKAKLNSDSADYHTSKIFLRINVFNSVKDSKIQCRSLIPVWNEVLKVQRMVFMTPERLTNNPAIVSVEVYNTELSGNLELIGNVQVKSTVSETSDLELAPMLQWYDLHRGEHLTGQVLMSAQLIQIPERLLKTIIYSPLEQSYIASNASREVESIDNYTPLPDHLLPISTLYKVDVYWWGFRNIQITRKLGVTLEIENLRIKSDIIVDRKSNCNFPNGRISQIFEGPINEVYCSMLNIRLFDSNSFGRIQYLGTNVVKNPNKYILRWLPKTDRDASLRRASVISSEFIKVNQELFIKNKSQTLVENTAYNACSISTSKSKKTKLKRLFWNKNPDEEEHILLPLFSINKDSKIFQSPIVSKQNKWWLKYLTSLKDNREDEIVCVADKLIIYDSELENQAEFSKFKDWCASLKLYNGKKTGIPERDKQLYSGLLKAGLAIYRWPPSDGKTAVAFSGIDLNRGFFDDHPNNDPARFLIRVYIVRGINLKAKYFVENTSPYVILSCGNKQFGNRNCPLTNKSNPVFGKMYELRCNLPEDYLLSISLYDYDPDSPSSDELIGSTQIDLEDRIYSKHRARIGLSFKYSLNDPFQWRDCVKPSAILQDLCSRNYLPPPVFTDNNTLLLNGVEYKDNEKDLTFASNLERKENLCLSILHKWYTLPVCGYHLVPENVETRTLYNIDRPGIEQGKIQMWVDIFPLDIGVYIPPPTEITPAETENYDLRATIYNVQYTNVGPNSFRRRFSDIYVRSWIGSIDQTKYIDAYYQSNIPKESNFNRRLIFHFQYQPDTREIFCNDKRLRTGNQDNMPPILNIQLMDNEVLSPNDGLGLLTLDLTAIPQGAKRNDKSILGVMNSFTKIDLFLARSLRAWWPITQTDLSSNKNYVVAKIHLEMELLAIDDKKVSLSHERHEGLSNGLCNRIKKSYYCEKNFILILAVCLLFVLEIVLALYFELPMILLEYWS